jgi:hypothetical protein
MIKFRELKKEKKRPIIELKDISRHFANIKGGLIERQLSSVAKRDGKTKKWCIFFLIFSFLNRFYCVSILILLYGRIFDENVNTDSLTTSSIEEGLN